MILIGRRTLIVLWVVVLAATSFLGVYGYLAVARTGEGPGSLFAAQQFLYLSLLGFLLEGALFLRTLLRSKNIERELEKLIDIARVRGLTGAQNLARLGPIGVQISKLYDQLNALSERKTLKISSLSELTEFLMNNIPIPAAVATVDGTVVYVSRTLTERLKRPRNELLDSRLEELALGIAVPDVVAELERAHSSIQRRGDRSELSLYPIRNAANQLAYIVCVFQSNPALVEQARFAISEEGRKRMLGGGVRRIIDFGRSAARRITGEHREAGPDRE